MFQSTHPCGVRLNCHLAIGLLLGFNPRTRVGCDQLTGIKTYHTGVSIHAPVWGATIIGVKSVETLISFNPRTRVGCDLSKLDRLVSTSKFQSTHPCGVRQAIYCFYPVFFSVSIHAPVWGATWQRGIPHLFCSFNPRTRVGCDCMTWQHYQTSEFQSTHPCGVRPLSA